MKINEKIENQQLYLTMCDKDTANLCQTLNVYSRTKRNCKIVYGFLVYLSQKDIDFSTLQKTGRECDIYQLQTKNTDKLIPVTVRTIEKWTGIHKDSVWNSLQHLINLGIITKTRQLIPDTNTNTNSNTNVNSNSSTLYISTLRDEKVESETDNNFKQDLNMEEKLNEKKFQEMNVRKNKIMCSIERFITASPSLSDEEIKKYIELYTNKLKEVYYRQDYAENAINIMIGRVAKTRTKKTTPTETKQNCDQKVQINKPLDWMLTNLPKPTVDNIVQTIALYCQYVCDYLTKEYNNPEYRHKVESHKYWYLDNLFTYYAPVLQEYAKTVKNRDLSLDEAEGCICQIWMKHCKDFPIA